MSAMQTATTSRSAPVKNPCRRCGHSPDAHRFDDYRLAEFNHVPWDERPFRCLGESLPYSGHTPCAAACPDFIGEPVTIPADRTGGEQ